jgi:hypothetical protein
VMVFGIMIAVMAVSPRAGPLVADLTRDPLQVARMPVYTGMLSNLGALIWTGTAAICLFSYAVTRRQTTDGASAHFLLAGGLFTTTLLLDDFFMLHEIVFPRYLGVPEQLIYAGYGLALVWFLGSFRSTLLETDWLLFACALAAFGLSLIGDLIEAIVPFPGSAVIEDSAKLVGIMSWAAYFMMFSRRSCRLTTMHRGIRYPPYG